MKILLTNNFADAMAQQPKPTITEFIEAVDKLQNLAKPQILLLDTVVELSSPDEKSKLFAYNITGSNYVIFTFTPKNEMLLTDYVKICSKGFSSLTYPNISTVNNIASD